MELTTTPWHRPPLRSDLPPELPTGKEGEEPTDVQRAMVLREAVNYYIRSSFRAPDVRAICEEFIAAVDETMGGSVPIDPVLPDVPGVEIEPTSVIIPVVGGSGSIAVTITEPGVSGTWTVDKDSTADWLSYAPMTPQSANGPIIWNAEANPDPVERVAHLYVNGKTFTLTQEATPAAVTLSPDVVPVLGSGDSGSVAVTVVTPGTWVVQADPLAPWLTYTPTTPQSASGTVTWTADANATGQTRQAILRVNGEPFTVNQGTL